jgi:hypothetical protein
MLWILPTFFDTFKKVQSENWMFSPEICKYWSVDGIWIVLRVNPEFQIEIA